MSELNNLFQAKQIERIEEEAELIDLRNIKEEKKQIKVEKRKDSDDDLMMNLNISRGRKTANNTII